MSRKRIAERAWRLASRGGRCGSGGFRHTARVTDVIVTQLTAGIPIQAAGAARLMYARGRDNAVPRMVFGHLPRLRTWVYNLML